MNEVVDHIDALHDALDRVRDDAAQVDAWGAALCAALRAGGKVLAAGNGGSAALAGHFTAELVGRYLHDREPLPALWIGADQAALTALLNDYGPCAVFERQVRAFARPGDVVLLLSTSGRSPNVLAAAQAARACGAQVWALTGPCPNPLAGAADRVLASQGATPIVQEVHQVLVHLVCASLDEHLSRPLTSG
jgi:phosphoheptose isomerase